MFGLDTFGTTLFCIGALGTIIYTIKMFMMLVLGISDGDIMDVDVEGIDFTINIDSGESPPEMDINIDNLDSSFTWASIIMITSFMILFGWFSLGTYQVFSTEKLEWMVLIVAQATSIIIGGCAGYLGIKLNSWIIKQIVKVQHAGTMKRNSLIGQQGTVCIKTSCNKAGAVMIKTDNEVLMEMAATTHTTEILQPGRAVKIIGLVDKALVIEPIIGSK